MGCLHVHAIFRSTESKAVPPESLTYGPIIGEKGSENWQALKILKSHYTQAYVGGIILSLSFKWPALAVTQMYHKQTTMCSIIREYNISSEWTHTLCQMYLHSSGYFL